VTTSTRSTQFDHAVILVADLERAIADFAALGFTVTRGGVHTGGATKNALIAFEDGTYIELLTFTRRLLMRALPLLSRLGMGRLLGSGRSPLEERFRIRAANGEGLIDFALLPEAIETDLSRLRREGVRAEGPISGGRKGDGEPISWQIAIPAPPELPFFCADTTRRELRVPSGEARQHPNGAVGIASIIIAVESLETSSARYQAMLGVAPEPASSDQISGGRGRLFNLGGTDVVVATSSERSNPLRQHLKKRGEGPFSLRIRCSDAGGSQVLASSRTHGARLELFGGPSLIKR
jgi:catechol 2,3-dioxygenase-like lactoylglutathione lyase family enzyme